MQGQCGWHAHVSKAACRTKCWHHASVKVRVHAPPAAEGLVLEVKGAVGGEEACVFAGELLAMYRSFCHSRGWRFDVISQQSSEYGHCKHAVVDVTGAGAYR